VAKPEQIANPELRALLERAHELMRTGKATEAVRAVTKAYLQLLTLKPELLDQTVEVLPGRRVPAVMRWPALGANLTLESVLAKQPQIEFVRERFSVSEAITYYEYALDSAVAQGA
jgi:hypothetical protein